MSINTLEAPPDFERTFFLNNLKCYYGTAYFYRGGGGGWLPLN